MQKSELRKVKLKNVKEDLEIYYFHKWVANQNDIRSLSAIIENSKGEIGIVHHKSIVFID